MTVKDLQKIIDEMIIPLQIKAVMTLGREKPTKTTELLITYPEPGYQGIGVLIGGEEIMWTFHYNGSEWLFDFDLIAE